MRLSTLFYNYKFETKLDNLIIGKLFANSGKKALHKQKGMDLNLKPTIPQWALIMVCRIIHEVINHYSTMKIY